MSFKYDKQTFFDNSNGGLDYILHIYPEADGCFYGKNKKFKFRRGEHTASALLTQDKKGVYYITDFGPGENISAIDLCMQENSLDFYEALKYLYEWKKLAVGEVTFFKSKVEFKTLEQNDYENNYGEGYWHIEYLPEAKNIKKFAHFCTPELALEYTCKEVAFYQKTFINKKNNLPTLLTVYATENYPIFAYDNKDKGFAKIYEPRASEIDEYANKHHFLGTKPKRHIYGLDRLYDKVNFAQLEVLHNNLKKLPFTKKAEREAIQKDIKALQLPYVIVCTGGSDGLNTASLEYNVIWFNSESEQLTKDEYYDLSIIAQNIYNLPDLDKTGVRQAVKLGMHILKLKTIWLPRTIKKAKIKDVRDYVTCQKSIPLHVIQSEFAKLLNQALEFKFWEFTNGSRGYAINRINLYYFLKHQGFHVHVKKSDNDHEETRFIQVIDNIVKVVSPRQVKAFVLDWLKDEGVNKNVWEVVLRCSDFSENNLVSLVETELNTKTATPDSQVYFFKNRAVKVTPEAIIPLKYTHIESHVWETAIIPHIITIHSPYFTIANKEGMPRITINNNSSNYLKVLINTSRLFWQKDANATGHDTNAFNINSKHLTDEENQLQELHLINKIYCIGYLLHKYKKKSKSWLILGVDKKIGAYVMESNGGSGKSFIIGALRVLLRGWIEKDGRSLHKEDPKFILDGVTAETDLINYDDLSPNYDFRTQYSQTTNDMTANHKGGAIYKIPFSDSPKIAATSNYVPKDLDASTMRRLKVYYACDYYHQATEGNDYPFTRKISDSFEGKDILMEDYPEAEWNKDLNFMLQCLQFYLQCVEPIEAPMEDVIIRNNIQKIGDSMYQHCEAFFKDVKYLNTWFPRTEIQDDYKTETGGKGKTPQSHKKSLELYCHVKGWSLTTEKKAIDPTPENGLLKRKSVEHYFIDTNPGVLKYPAQASVALQGADALPETNANDDLPF